MRTFMHSGRMVSTAAAAFLLPLPSRSRRCNRDESTLCRDGPSQPMPSAAWLSHPHGVKLARCRCEDSGAIQQQTSFASRLQQETCVLLARVTKRPAAATDGRSVRASIEELCAPEMAALYSSVEGLAVAVDVLVDSGSRHSGPPGLDDMSSVLAAYTRFLESLAKVEHACYGGRPLAETLWWPSLLMRWRYHVCSLLSWGLLTEAAVQEASAALHALGVDGLVDPLAGSGWHARLWQDAGHISVAALDSYPKRPVAWADVVVVPDSRHVADWGISHASGRSAASFPQRWALFLSWPPHSPETVGVDLLRCWPGDFLVYVGEHGSSDEVADGDAGVTGGQELLDAIAADWEPVKTWAIPCWPGYRDDMTIYHRRRRKGDGETVE
eukprot:gnl/TRDRNA2_/TRDRNA2_32911_c0_seq1.p1 gnl/TRDRNA2_/TRDRNA2_32911_c0~~gnl/TRDRNA2_/TRDRNA2_32911_c0_seq1.p1  ORF type:complete len:384 (+),score=49.86 gnl/TRDRNA2_/TRDRNA2_32911_c0_seq1:44-1195(+)